MNHADRDQLTDEDVQQTTEAAYERLRRYPDRTLAQIAIAESATDVAETAMSLVADRDGRDLYSDVDAAARLLQEAQNLLESAVLAARLGGQSWDAIGEAVTGAEGKRQTMINRYGHLEGEWKDALLEPVEADRDPAGRIRATRSRIPDAVGWDLEAQVARLQQFLDTHRPGRELGLPGENASARVADYLWRLNAATDKYGVSGIPAALAADIDARKAQSLAAGEAELADAAAARTQDEDQ